ncbi:MAG: hypothetical protein IJE82_00080, partial [Alphaproteobacteria bacterium]|nr:hypothetical protein [Alphaproteobacteria bacterium]
IEIFFIFGDFLHIFYIRFLVRLSEIKKSQKSGADSGAEKFRPLSSDSVSVGSNPAAPTRIQTPHVGVFNLVFGAMR